MRILISTILLLSSFSAFSQGPVDRIELGYQTTKRGIVWVRPGLPTHEPVWRVARDTNAILWHNLTTGIRYDWSYATSEWNRADVISQTLPPIESITSGLATINNTTADWINDDGILHFYDNAIGAWVPHQISYQSLAPVDVAAGVSNAAAVYTTTLWQDSDDFLIRYYDGDSWELIGGGTDLTFSGASSPVTLNSSTGTDVTFTAGTGISLAGTSTDLTISGTAAGLSKWTDAGAFTYLTATGDRALVGSSTELNSSYILQANGGFFAKGTGATSSTFTAQLHNSTGTNNGFVLRDDGRTGFGTNTLNYTHNFSGASASAFVGFLPSSMASGDIGFYFAGPVVTGGTSPLLFRQSASTGLQSSIENQNTASSTAHNRFELSVGGVSAGDPKYLLTIPGAVNWSMSADNSNSDKFIIAGTDGPGSGFDFLTITTAGLTGILTNNPQQTLHVAGTARITGSDGTATTVMGRDGDGDISALALSGMSISGGTLTATDGSPTNEAWTIDADDADTEVISNQTVKFQGGGIITTDYIPGTDILTITGTEVDGSTTNELQTIANTSDATSHTGTLSNSGGSIQFVEGSGITLTTTGTGLNGIVTIAATGAGTDLTFSGASSPVTLNSSTGTDVTFTAGGINSLSATGTNITITATEVDGSTTNELQTYGHAGTTTYTNTLSSGGGSWSITGAGIAAISQTGGAITVTATEVDGSTTNELQTIANTSNSTSHTATLSSSGGSLQLIEGSGVLLTTGGTGLDGTVTIEAVDPSMTNEIQTLSASGAGPTSYNIDLTSSGTSVTLAEGSGIDLTRSTNTITIASTGITSATGYINGGNSFGGAATIGLNDNFDWAFETNGTTRGWIDNAGTYTIGSSILTTAALNISGLQNNIGMHVAGGTGLTGPVMLQTRGTGSGSDCTVLDAQHFFTSGNVVALFQNTSTTGTGGVEIAANAKTATGDPRLHLEIDGTTDWSLGIDNDDVDNLKLHRFASPSDNNGVGTMEFGYDGTSLGVAINKTGIGTAANQHYGLDVGGKARADQFVNNNPGVYTTGTYALGTAAGTSPTLDGAVSAFWGNGGRLKFTSGTSPTTNGVICTVTLGTEYTFSECAPIMQGRTTNTGGFDYVATFNSGTRVITFTLIGTLAASTAYEFNIIVSGYN
jgi:hypothetical protein